MENLQNMAEFMDEMAISAQSQPKCVKTCNRLATNLQKVASLDEDEKKQKISNLLSVTLAARKKLIRNTGGKGKSCWFLTDAGASQCRLYNQSCRRTCKTL